MVSNSLENKQATVEKDPREQLSVLDLREELVQKGNFVAIYESILQTKWHAIDLHAAFSQLLRAMDVASRSPAAFASELFRMMTTIAGYLMLRAQYQLAEEIEESDLFKRTITPTLRIDLLLPQIMEIQTHVAGICQTWASTTRLHELARGKRLENDQAEERASSIGKATKSEASSPRAEGQHYGAKGKWGVGGMKTIPDGGSK